MKPWFGYRGMGMKSGDMNVVPLCNGHHMGLHHLGNEDKFWEACGKQSDYGRASAIRIWETSPVKEELEEWTPKVIKR